MKPRRFPWSSLLPTLVGVALLLPLSAGLARAGAAPPGGAPLELGSDPAAAPGEDVVHAAARVITDRLPAQVDASALDEAAIRGMTRWLDETTGIPGNALLSEAEDQARRSRLLGTRNGLGIEYAVAAGRGLVITTVFPGSPAAAAEMAPGDVVVALLDHPFTGMAGPAIQQVLDDQARHTRAGAEAVTLDLRREDGALRRLSLSPGPFEVAPARVTMDDAYVLVRIAVLGPGTADVVAAAVADAGRRPVILDLRDLAEGTVEDAVAVAGLFLPAGQVVLRTVDPAGLGDTRTTAGRKPWRGRLAVMVNHGSAGLAEALASALRTGARAAVVGTRTAGVATQPSFHPLGQGLVLQLADTTLIAGDGGSWARTGLAPDLVVEPIGVPLVGRVPSAFPDIQLEAALRYLASP